MKWSWRIGRIVSIDIRVHATFPLRFAWIAVLAVRGGATSASAVGSLALLLAVLSVLK